EIIGSKRMKRNVINMNWPIVPKNKPKSQRVGEYKVQDDGRKSRLKLTTIITKRSSHIPTLIDIEMPNSQYTLVRIGRIQSSCGMRIFVRMSSQYAQPIGPMARLIIMYRSQWLPLYHA